MKVLQVIDSGGLYGAERVLLALMDALRELGVESVLASIAEPGLPDKPVEAAARADGHEVWRIAMAAGPDRSAAKALARSARNEGFVVLHTHGYKANALLGGMRRRERGLPVVATLHGWTATKRLSRMWAYESIERLALRRAERVVAVSEAMVATWHLRRRYGGRLRVIHNGIPAQVDARVSRRGDLPIEIQDFIRDHPAIFAAGRLSLEKGFDVLVAALAHLHRRGIEARLVLVGEGREREALETQARELGITHAVMMPGYLEDASRLMPAFDAVAIPSRSEGLPIVLLEALFAKVPVVATRVGEMPSVLEHCGARQTVLPDNPGALAEALAEAWGEDSTSRLEGVAGQAREAYSASAMARQYRALYDQVLAAA